MTPFAIPHVPHRDGGGMVPTRYVDPQQAVLLHSVAERLAPMTPDELRNLIPRLGDSPVAQIAQQVLEQKLQADQTTAVARASGGASDASRPKENTVPILAAGGEFVIAPHHVARLGEGDIGEGHRRLDRWVVETRKKIVDKMRSLKPPVKS